MSKSRVIAGMVWLEVVRRKDVYVAFILLGAFLFTLISLDIFGLSGAVRYVKEIGLLMAWLFSIVISITISGRQLPQEESKGTIYPLLAKPVTRWSLIVGKWLGCWSIASFATLVFYVFLGGVVWLEGAMFWEVSTLQAYLLHACFLGMLVALTLAFSTRMTYGAVVSFAAVFLAATVGIVPMVPKLVVHAKKLEGLFLTVLYYMMPHFELFDLRRRVVHSWGTASWGLLAVILVYGMVWIALFLGIAWLGYRRKYFKRGV